MAQKYGQKMANMANMVKDKYGSKIWSKNGKYGKYGQR